MKRFFALALMVAVGSAQEAGPKGLVDVGKVLRGSKEFAKKCADFKIAWGAGVVRAQGEIHYRGGGPCEYLVAVYPRKAHETIILLDRGAWTGEGRRPRDPVQGLAEVLNNAFIAAGFKKGKHFDWDRKTGDVFPPKGETVYLYAEWKDQENGKDGKKSETRRARVCDWLWNFRLIEVMADGKFVYTGSLLIDEDLPGGGKRVWLGAEVDGLIAAVLNTSSALIDNLEEGALDNGAYEAIPIRIPESGTRVTMVFSNRKLEVTENYPLLKLPKAAIEEKKRRAAEAARKKLDEEKKKPAAAGDGKK